ncbi:MAG: pantetheine-phosphate adenylyltransferase [Caldisericaceae bacterium]
MKTIVYPGTFDPLTNGHLEIIERASKIFDKVVVLVAKREEKHTLFTVEERLEMVKMSLNKFKNVEADVLDTLLVDYLKNHKINLVLRGLRTYQDFEYEKAMFEMNYELNSGIETIFLITRTSAFISSTLVKEVAMNNGDVSKFVPEIVNKKIKDKIRKKL